MKQTAYIENWMIQETTSGKKCLVGIVSDHPDKFANSWAAWDVSQTSELLSLDEATGTAETKNTIYTLGRPARAAA